MFRHRARRGEGLGLLLLAGQLMRVGFDRIPPTTLGTIAINVAIYLKVLNPYIRKYIRNPSITSICVSTYSVWYQGDWSRLALAAWFHLDDWHLYFNMVSFLWKGISLERRFGTFYFAYLIAVFSLLTNAIMVGLNMVLAEVLEDESYVVSCAAGFSGVIFALKVLTTHYTLAGTQYVMGFPVPSRYACWAELVLIQLLVPRASFTGHLAGILVGLAFVRGPLKPMLDVVPSILTTARGFQGSARGGRSAYTYMAGTTTEGRPRGGRSAYTYTAGTTTQGRPMGGQQGGHNNYAAGMNEEEQLQEAIRASLRTGGRAPSSPSTPADSVPNRGAHPARPSAPSAEPSAPPADQEQHGGPRLYPDLSNHAQDPGGSWQGPPSHLEGEELRRRRLARFDR